MKVTSSGLVFKWTRFSNQTGGQWDKYRATRGNVAGKYGYRQVWVNGSHVYTHRLICEAFHGPSPGPQYQVNHKNGITCDNRPSNLEWVTAAENTAHKVKVLKKYTKPKVSYDFVKELLASGRTGKEVAQLTGLSPSRVCQIKKGKHL